MSPPPTRACYLVEWYRPEIVTQSVHQITATLDDIVAAMDAEGSAMDLILTLVVPDDEVAFGVIAAGSAQTVDRACRRAGLPAGRLSAAVAAGAWPLLMGGESALRPSRSLTHIRTQFHHTPGAEGEG